MPHPLRSKPLVCTAVLTVICVLHLAELSNPNAAAEPLSQKDDFAQRLRESHTGLVDGQSLRLAIGIVSQHQTQPNRHINTWLDRKVNPDYPVSPGNLGPTRYASLCKIAASAGCVCYPVDNCVLIGRPSWVAELSHRLDSDAQDDAQNDAPGRRPGRGDAESMDLQWPDLTTPDEALQLVRGHSAGRQSGDHAPLALPHDLWPETLLRDISPQLALRLIAGQFLGQLSDARIDVPFARSYQFAGASRAIAELRKTDPNLQTKVSGGQIRLLATPAAHQAFCRQMLSIPDGEPVPAQGAPAAGNALERLKTNQRTFSLDVADKPAGPLIQALVAQLGLQCQFDPAANPQLEKRVSFSAVDQTLWQLVRLITDQASLKIDAAGDKLRLSAKN
ncbi:hypothetical protein Enr13x_07510 [Stieleria neptunia]|uniref:DUF2066 domain-containing protein n=1 Tax=Stieleria neptunia TaxID=2527979 RepID=A0A518HJ85_9BACT|nr:hypothetical protein [Stieleria neptunia]QDV40914.1 hypothetical protein Enr13x_07510 [Stieleria neptunia]